MFFLESFPVNNLIAEKTVPFVGTKSAQSA